jgi:hypothetical protein
MDIPMIIGYSLVAGLAPVAGLITLLVQTPITVPVPASVNGFI